jgi:hypothetical protein
MFVSLNLALKHLRVEADGDDEDLIELYLGAAVQAACEFINRRIFEDQAALDAAVTMGAAGDYPMLANDAIRAAVLLILGMLYENREDVVIGLTAENLPRGSRALLQPYRVNMGV